MQILFIGEYVVCYQILPCLFGVHVIDEIERREILLIVTKDLKRTDETNASVFIL